MAAFIEIGIYKKRGNCIAYVVIMDQPYLDVFVLLYVFRVNGK